MVNLGDCKSGIASSDAAKVGCGVTVPPVLEYPNAEHVDKNKQRRDLEFAESTHYLATSRFWKRFPVTIICRKPRICCSAEGDL